ncbi:MAG TPA: EAL domain-containing protein [Rubrivivax sp.]|nr:EAL domain-containing protein [Rubrivivax sp.]
MTPAPHRPVPAASVATRWAGPWLSFYERHLFDYPRAATAVWLAIMLAGALAGGWALWQLTSMPADSAPAVLLAVCLAALGSLSATKLPRSAYTFTVSEVFVLAALATLGPAVAVVATGVESTIATRRNSKRLSSRLSSPAASMAAIWVGGHLYLAARDVLVRWGQSLEVASLAALCGVALVPFLLSTLPLMAMMALKRREPMRPRQWLADSSGLALIYLGSAFVAGLVHLNALRFGAAVIVISAGVALGLVALLRLNLSRQEAERLAQEVRVSGAQREAALSQQRFMAAFTHAAIGMAIVRHEGHILQVNQALCSLVARTGAELVGRPFCQLLHEGDAALFQRQARAVLDAPDEAFSMEVRTLGAGGTECWVSVHCSRYEDPGGNGHCLIYQLHDITSRHLAESRLHHIAYHDGLTDLANRNYFHERLEVAVERTRLDAEQRFAVLFLDLDRFKMVNDSLGHMAGNQLLHEVAQRLRACVRPIDLVARLGGDEFAILLESLHDPESGLRLAHRVLDVLSQPLSINGTEVVPGASVGITFSDLGYRTVDEVLRDADLAMYEAKAGGRGRVALFDSSMHEKVAEKLALESDLRHAIGDGQLSVNFQPLFELEPYRLNGFEALARWVHPQRGPVSPAVFIALAEESGHIEALTDWIISHAVGQLATWRRLHPQAGSLGMHVNISGRDLARAGLVSHVRQVLEACEVPASALTLEITETTLMGRLDVALQNMGQLRELGVRFSIDDFGTGYSSLSYLSTLPIDSLKIDRSFVMGLHENPQNVEIVRAVLNLGLSLGRRVIAEGIETPRQLSALRELGVPVGQGYLLSRPLRAEQVQELLAVGTVLPV